MKLNYDWQEIAEGYLLEITSLQNTLHDLRNVSSAVVVKYLAIDNSIEMRELRNVLASLNKDTKKG
jgi:hypothetical protein